MRKQPPDALVRQHAYAFSEHRYRTYRLSRRPRLLLCIPLVEAPGNRGHGGTARLTLGIG